MDISSKQLTETKTELTVTVSQSRLAELKKHTLEKLQPTIEAPGFRKGKAPLNVVEKNVKSDYLQSQFLEEAINHSYTDALQQENLRPLQQPEITVKKFVPYSELSFTASLETVPPVKLYDYSKIKKDIKPKKVTDKDINDVLTNLQKRMAEKNEVKRAAKEGDQVTIDFSGVDKDGKEVAGAKGNDYPLAIGSDTFIPGFEDEIIGLKMSDEKTFDITFPKDYAHKPLANAKVTFSVKVKKVEEVNEPTIDNNFAKKLGPFKNESEMRADIKKQLTEQKSQEALDELKDEIIGEIVQNSTITIPDMLMQDQIKALREDFAQNLSYRGITLPDYLKQNEQTEEEFIEAEIKPKATRRVQSGLVLAEIAEKEKLSVTNDELDVRLQLLKGQNPSQAAQFDDDTMRRDVANRLLTEKTVQLLVDSATK